MTDFEPTEPVLDSFNKPDGFLKSNWTKAWEGIQGDLAGCEFWGAIRTDHEGVLRAGWSYGFRVYGGVETHWRRAPDSDEWEELARDHPEAISFRATIIPAQKIDDFS